jgi:ABC-2 type transport system permease protein
MTTTTLTPTPVPAPPARGALTFGGILRSEWIKLRTVRSTVWCYAIIIVLTVLFGILLASTFQGDMAGPLSEDDHQRLGVQAMTISIGFSQLVASVLGVLVISGEYGTGMIRSTLTAVPRRTPALLAKAVVFGAVTLAVGLIAIGGTALVTSPLLPRSGLEPDFGDPQLLFALGGGALYLTLVGVLSLTIGAIVRNSAGGIAASLGLLLVLPTVLQILGGITNATWVQNLIAFLPSSAGDRLYSYAAEASVSSVADGAMTDGIITLSSLQGGLVLGCWVVVLLLAAIALLKRRDV